jgi:hypothetical protein
VTRIEDPSLNGPRGVTQVLRLSIIASHVVRVRAERVERD